MQALAGYDSNFRATPSPATGEAFLQIAPRLDGALYVGDHSDLHGRAEVSLLRTAPDPLTGLSEFASGEYDWIRWSPVRLGVQGYLENLSLQEDSTLDHGRAGVAPRLLLPIRPGLLIEGSFLFENTTLGGPLFGGGAATDYSYSGILSAVFPDLPARWDGRATYQYERVLADPSILSLVANHLSVAAGRRWGALRTDGRFEFARYDFTQSIAPATGGNPIQPAVHLYKLDLSALYPLNRWVLLNLSGSGIWNLSNLPGTNTSRVVFAAGGEVHW